MKVKTTKVGRPKGRTMSKEQRKRISEAMKRRWAKTKNIEMAEKFNIEPFAALPFAEEVPTPGTPGLIDIANEIANIRDMATRLHKDLLVLLGGDRGR